MTWCASGATTPPPDPGEDHRSRRPVQGPVARRCRPRRPDGPGRPLPRVPRAAAPQPAGVRRRPRHRAGVPPRAARPRRRTLRAGAGAASRRHHERHDERGRRRPPPLADPVRLRLGHRHGPVLALPDLGVRPARALRPGAEDEPDLRLDRRPALPGGGRPRLPHPARRSRGADRVQPRGRHQPHRLQRLPAVLHPHAVRVRAGLQHPGLRGAPQLRRGGQGCLAEGLPALDHHRHLRLRRRRDAVGRSLHDDADGRADGRAVLRLRGHRPVQRPAAGAQRPQRGLAPDELSSI